MFYKTAACISLGISLACLFVNFKQAEEIRTLKMLSEICGKAEVRATHDIEKIIEILKNHDEAINKIIYVQDIITENMYEKNK